VKSWNALSEADIARFYVEHRGGPRSLPVTGTALYEDVRSYLQANRLDHRLNESAAIATEAYEIVKRAQAQQLPTPEQVAWANDQAQGIGDPAADLALRRADELVLAGQVKQMSQAEFAANRERFGLSTSMFTFLTGEPQ
jgi:hypothetical protein